MYVLVPLRVVLVIQVLFILPLGMSVHNAATVETVQCFFITEKRLRINRPLKCIINLYQTFILQSVC